MDGILKLLQDNSENIRKWVTLEIPVTMLLVGALYLILKKNVFDPIGGILDERARRLASAAHAEKEALGRHEEALKRCEHALREAHVKAGAVRDEARRGVAAECDSVLSAARDEAEVKLAEAMKTLDGELDRGRRDFRQSAPEMARLLVDRLLEEGRA